MSLLAPAYGQRPPASKASSRAKSVIKRSKTRPEVLLARALRLLGVRSRRTERQLLGKPDFIFSRKKVVVFCDGDFWHGRNWPQRRAKLLVGWNADYWISKIEYNRKRDRHNTRQLKNAGWKVIRLWELDILRDPIASAIKVLKTFKI